MNCGRRNSNNVNQTTFFLILILFIISILLCDGYKVKVIDRMLSNKPLILNASANSPYSKSGCDGSICTNVLNPAWISFAGDDPSLKDDGGLFIRLSSPGTRNSVISLLPAIPNSKGLQFDLPQDKYILKDGPKNTDKEVAEGDDPRAIYRPLTGEYFVFYQTLWNRTRKTQISSTKTPRILSSWKRFKHTMFSKNDCGTTLWFPEDEDDSIPLGKKRAFAIATFGTLRGGNLSLVTSNDGMQSWEDHGEFIFTRPDHWDNATLSSGPPPQKLSDGNWLFLYNVDNKWPVADPKPFPYFGRCALGWVVLDKNNFTNVLARSEEPLVYAQYPWEKEGTTDMVVYTDGIRPEGDDTFTVFAGGADTVIEAFTIKVEL